MNTLKTNQCNLKSAIELDADDPLSNFKNRFHFPIFNSNEPNKKRNFINNLNPYSIITLNNCRLEKSLENAKLNENYQFLLRKFMFL